MVKTISRYWRSYLVPNPAALTLVSVAGASIGLGFLCGALYGISSAATFADGVGRFAFLFGVITLPLAALLLLVAAFREKRFLPRGLVIGMTGLIVVVSGFATALGLGSDIETPLVVSTATFLFCFAPPALILFGGALYFSAKGWTETRVAIADDRERRTLEMLEARGEMSLVNLANELEISAEACVEVVEAALRAGRFAGWHDAPGRRVYSATALQERQTRLAAIVVAHGQIRLDDLTRELSAPADLVKTWIYALVQRGEFTGYLNWAEGILYSAEAQRLTEAGRCPYCNGELALAGKGVIRCDYCGSEIFL